MAPDPKKKKLIGQPKKKVSPQTRVKESQASKKRKRQTKGSQKGGQFSPSGIKKSDLGHIFHKTVHGRSGPSFARAPGGGEQLGLDQEAFGSTEQDALGQQQPDEAPPHEIKEARPSERRKGAGGRNREAGSLEPNPYQGDDEIPTRNVDRGRYPEQSMYQTYDDAYNYMYSVAKTDHTTKDQADTISHLYAEEQTMRVHGKSPSRQYMRGRMGPGITVRAERPEEVWGSGGIPNPDSQTGETYPPGRVTSEGLWQDHRGTVAGSGTPQGDIEWDPTWLSETKSVGKVLGDNDQTLKPDEKDWLKQQMQTEGSPYYRARTVKKGDNTLTTDYASQRRAQQYATLRQKGYGHEESHQFIQEGGANKQKGPRKKTATPKQKQMEKGAKKDMEDRLDTRPGKKGYKKKHDDGKGSHKDFGYGIQVPGVDSLEDLRKRFPDWSESDVIRYHQEQRRTVYEHTLQQNERWAHETRAQRLADKGSNLEGQNRVVVFTTNAGGPTASVAANSLIGQYVIKKRKKLVVDDKQATRYEVKGEFPRAVRDQHIIEVSTGVSIGAQGRYGVFQHAGWRKGSKRSEGYGKDVPLGATVLKDASGQPIYDDDGNVRYTEGYTRSFGAGTSKDVGLRIFIG